MLILSAVFFVAVGLLVLNMCHAAVAERLDKLNNETLSDLVHTKKVRTTSMSSVESGRKNSEMDMLEPLLEDMVASNSNPVTNENTTSLGNDCDDRQKSLSTASVATTVEEEGLSRTSKIASCIIRKFVHWNMMVYSDEV